MNGYISMLRTTATSGRWRRPAVLAAGLALAALLGTGSALAAAVGNVVFAKGAVSARDGDGGVRLLGRDSEVFRLDTISTADNSFAVIRFLDQTKMSIRPNSEIVIDEFNGEVGSEAAEFNLLKGGLRAITGAIGSRRPESVRFRTRAASIGIRGTDLVIRDCVDDTCQAEELALASFDPVRTECLVNLEGQPPGVYFAAIEGVVFGEKDGREVELVAPGAGYADDEDLTCISGIPRFILQDEYLNRINLDWSEFEFFEVLGVGDNGNPMCELL